MGRKKEDREKDSPPLLLPELAMGRETERGI